MKFLNRTQKSCLAGLVAVSMAPVTGCAPSSDSVKAGTLALALQGTKPGSLTVASAKAGYGALGVNDIAVYDVSGVQIGTLTLTSARAALKEIEFDREDEDQAVEDIDLRGPYIVDLLTNVVSPSIENISLPSGIYKAIELDLDKIQGDEVDADGNALISPTDPLYGNSIYVEGTYTGSVAAGTGASGGNSVTNAPFSMSFDLDEQFELSPPGATSEGFSVGADTVNNIIIAFRLARWFAFDNPDTNSNSLDFSSLDATGGSIALDESSLGNNKDIRTVIKENIKESADYGNDIDTDGQLASDEDDDLDDGMDD